MMIDGKKKHNNRFHRPCNDRRIGRSNNTTFLAIIFLIIIQVGGVVVGEENNRSRWPNHHHHRNLFETRRSMEGCFPVDVCKLCTPDERAEIPQCVYTGRSQRVQCYIEEEKDEIEVAENEPSPTSTITYRSCNRTKEDDEFLMVRMQVFWLLVGSFAFMSVRKNRQESASLFDQRKQRGGGGAGASGSGAAGLKPKRRIPQRGGGGDDHAGGIELTTRYPEETVPLNPSSSPSSSSHQQGGGGGPIDVV